MMLSPDEKKYIRDEIKRALDVILPGVTAVNPQDTVATEGIQNMYPGMATIVNRPVMHPYGFASRAPVGTTQVVAKNGEHVGNRMVIGHRAGDRPEVNVGDVTIYNSAGKAIAWISGDIKIGSTDADEPLVLGNVLKQFCIDLLTALETHTHISSAPGVATSPPVNVADFTNLKLSPIQDDGILSDSNFTEK